LPDFIPNIDRRTIATLALPNDVVGTVIFDLGMPPFLGFIPCLPHNAVTVECEGDKIELYNYLLPTLYHSIKVVKHDGTLRVEKAYTFVEGEGRYGRRLDVVSVSFGGGRGFD
jgi:hypothetical protein